jgi:hypothetical protein
MRYGLSNFFGAIAAWLCLAPVAFTYEPLSMPGTLNPAAALMFGYDGVLLRTQRACAC